MKILEKIQAEYHNSTIYDTHSTNDARDSFSACLVKQIKLFNRPDNFFQLIQL